jgi:HEAT repeat protein
MNTTSRLALGAALLLLATGSLAQSDTTDDTESLRIAAIEALITAPPARALPIVEKVLAGNHSNELKERALFILSQLDTPEAQSRLVAFASSNEGELQAEAIRMIGISGDQEAMAALGEMYRAGDADVREAVLEAYLIADDEDAVFDIAINTEDEEEFSEAVSMLGAMGAHQKLRDLRGRAGLSESLIEAYAISGDPESVNELVGIYNSAETGEIKQSALEGLMIAGHDEGMLELYRNAGSPSEKRQILEYLVMMDSEAVWDLIDNAFEGSQ